MEILKQFEYPLPILKILTEKIVIETSGTIESSLKIQNAGSGILNGRIMSNSPSLKFSEESFSGNSITINYIVDCSGSKSGDIIQSDVIIMSNGGEKIIPVIIKIIQAFITTPENIKISNLKEFLAYAKKYPIQARQMFLTQDFMIWLMNIGYEYMDIYDYLIKDPNKERALENFFILSKLKNKPIISASDRYINIAVKPVFEGVVDQTIPIKKSGWGYVETEVVVRDKKDWFNLNTTKLISSDFDETDTAYISFEINAKLLTDKISKVVLALADGIKIEINVKKKSLLSLNCDKESYEFDDKGFIIIQNNSNTDLMVDIFAKDNFIKFEGKRYFIGEYAEIPFTIKMSALQLAQYALKKVPVVTSEIDISTGVYARAIKKTVVLNIGNRILV